MLPKMPIRGAQLRFLLSLTPAVGRFIRLGSFACRSLHSGGESLVRRDQFATSPLVIASIQLQR